MRHAINERNYRKLLKFAVTVSFLWSTNGCNGTEAVNTTLRLHHQDQSSRRILFEVTAPPGYFRHVMHESNTKWHVSGHTGTEMSLRPRRCTMKST